MPMKECNYRGCHGLVSIKETYCMKHNIKHKEDKTESNKSYDKTRDKKIVSFYHSKSWNIQRENIKQRDNGLCILCLSKNKIKNMDMVHHILEIKENYNQGLNKYNLISLCDKCHKLIHIEYQKGLKNKIKTQTQLSNIIKSK